ncbi:sensor histidine kinase [Cellulomonas sp. S1-8]|uniref:sensor histidine kinase n=1 Tax=Cellulomonas sp. S1-8 TaxID=2904790 RepID=UPI002242C7CF|nr:ATP-binding protein [Cellulomonas sp. S1-8]UZN04062.1 ATP-binding protein [Cellulomonas sp. S1-8]
MSAARESVPAAVRARDVAADRGSLLRATAIVAGGYAVGASLQSVWIYASVIPDWAGIELWRRLAANGIAVVGLVVGLSLLRVHRAPGPFAIATRVLFASVFMGLVRIGVQVGLGVYAPDQPTALTTELVTGAFIAVIASSSGVWAMSSRRSMRAVIRAAERETVSVELAVQALEAEEIRVRRQVAEGLHGTVQQRLVLVDARLAAAQEQVARVLPQVAEEIALARAELAESRENDVRQVSRLLYPDRLEMGLVPAVRALLSRLPATIATRLQVGDELRKLDDPAREGLTVPERLLAVRVVEEAVTNALKNGPPTFLEVELGLAGDTLHVSVTNDGDPYDPPTVPDPASGTARLRQRLRLAGGSLQVLAREPTGVRVEASMPVGLLPPEAP